MLTHAAPADDVDETRITVKSLTLTVQDRLHMLADVCTAIGNSCHNIKVRGQVLPGMLAAWHGGHGGHCTDLWSCMTEWRRRCGPVQACHVVRSVWHSSPCAWYGCAQCNAHSHHGS